MDASPSLDALLRAVERDLERGVWSVPLKAGRKRPAAAGWGALRMQAETARAHFAPGMNRGRLLGVPAPGGEGCLVVVDLDVPEAVALAPFLLPPTGEVGGRANNPRSHWYYFCAEPPPIRRFNGPGRRRLVELLSRGAQVVAPPSIHPSGDAYQWFEDGPAHRVDGDLVQRACIDLAMACVIAGTSEPSERLLAQVEAAVGADRTDGIREALRSMERVDIPAAPLDASFDRILDAMRPG